MASGSGCPLDHVERAPEVITGVLSAARYVRELHRQHRALRGQLAKLAALVDHYWSAYRECQSLLERREREPAELHRKLAPGTVTRLTGRH
jgi:hypothetical protein